MDAGYQSQLNVDFSPKAISMMAERVKHEGIQWVVQDVRNMKDIRDSSIDVAIDKVWSLFSCVVRVSTNLR